MHVRVAVTLLACSLFAGCGAHAAMHVVPQTNSMNTLTHVQLPTVRSASPASISVPPMVRTALQPASSMTSLRRTKGDLGDLGWTQLPGAAVAVAASPDGSMWVLSTQGGAVDKYIYHYANGSWANIPGMAMRLAVAPNGHLWVVNSYGGIYQYDGSTWTAMAGGASDISIGSDGSVYVISSVGPGPDRGIWKYSNGNWTQMPGAAVRVAAAWDPAGHPGFAPGGFFVTNSSGAIYYYNPGTGYEQLPGGAVQVAPLSAGGGLFALGDPSNPFQHGIYYFDLDAHVWTQKPGAAVNIATYGSTLYAIGGAGGIYTSALTVTAPPSTVSLKPITAPDTGQFAPQVVVAANGTTWYSEIPGCGYPGPAKVARVSASGAVSEIALTRPWVAWSNLVAAPNGSVWFAEVQTNAQTSSSWCERLNIPAMRLAHISVNGSLTEFPAPASPNYPVYSYQNLALGADHNLWFIASDGASIQAVSPAGTPVSSYPVQPNAWQSYTGYQPVATAILEGPDGNIWVLGVTDAYRVTPAGNVTVFPYPPQIVSAFYATVGADANIWFIDSTYNIVRMTTSGTFTQFPATSRFIAQGTGSDPVYFVNGLRLAKLSSSGVVFNSPIVAPAGDDGMNAIASFARAPNGNYTYVTYDTSGNPYPYVSSTTSLGQFAPFPTGNELPLPTGFLAGDVAASFVFPSQSGYGGAGQTVAILIDSAYVPSDLGTYLTNQQIPIGSRTIRTVLVDGAPAAPGKDLLETSLDVQTIASMAPNANIVVYVVPDLTTRSLIDGYERILQDGASIVSSSFGGCETNFATSGLPAIFATGAASGVAFVASSGDQGSKCLSGTDGSGNDVYVFGVNYPASDPSVIAVGGSSDTFVNQPTGQLAGSADFGWEGSGGGVSTVFPIPGYQLGLAGAASASWRNVPDVALPATGAVIVVNGQTTGVSGTSWSAPLFASLMAGVYEYCGVTAMPNPVNAPYAAFNALGYGAFNDLGYRAFIDIWYGENAYGSGPYYVAGQGYDNMTGIGEPLGMSFAQGVCGNRASATGARRLGPSRWTQSRTTEPSLPHTVGVAPAMRGVSDAGRRARSAATPIQLVLRSGSSAADERAVAGVLHAAGLTIDRAFSNHLVIDASGPSAAVESLFATEMHDVRAGSGSGRFAPLTPITIPSSLAPYLAGVTLDNVVRAAARPVRR